ncbi:MAG TPA: hypothetical protein QF698_04800, partial [Candidatus Marinimicrobia bacterium]|nr:hypothetical protein [Candidatus Neomarinimicrobiota bacterium]
MGKGNPGSTGDNGAGAKGKLQKGWKKWFAKNWEDAVEAGKSKVNVFPGVSGDHAANNRALIPGILPGLPKSPGINSKQKKVFEDFNKHIDLYWAKMIFGSLAAVDPSMRPPVPDERLPPNNEYFKYLEPQNNKGLSTGADGSIDNNGKRKGKPGWVMGPWVRDIQVEPVSNGSETYQEVAGPLDEEEWVLDDETGLPYNGGQELLMPIYADPPEVDPQTQEIIPERQVSMDPKVYGLKPAKPNPNKGKPLPEYGKAEMDENSILDTEDPEQVSHKKIFGTQHPTSRRQLVDKNILDGPPLDLCYYYKANSGSNFETWGPYEEAPKSSNWNYIVPTGLQSGLANAGTTERNPNGPSADGGTGDAGYSLPLKNSEYWGIRIASAKKQDGTPCSPADIAAGIPLPGGGGWITTTGETIMGPVPPARFGMKGFNSGAKARKIHKCFKSKRGSGCFNDDVKRSQSGGNSFKKNTSDGLSG